ncbi:DUF3331 domain-containing protein [Paraburkholderia oxyphila]|uniref:DUF3331 domain-containing protein n=1 Tax=Paraburkholderia oxyphila TaxID=614212 RepID=UPI0012EE8CF7|nr:DUF3331 domain-containing protein [Paraburkholderia oxyphila]
MRELGAVDAWEHTLSLLGGGSASRGKRIDDSCSQSSHTPTSLKQDAVQPTPALRAHLAVVETCSDNLVSVSWSDSTSGRYSEQPWRLCIARKGGVCALTGASIRRGDRVYRPLSRKLMSANAGWVVLASALNSVTPM